MNKGIDVEIIKDSTNWTGKRLTTFVLKYPRYIHSELMTHRVFSKNSASSRAIPIVKMISNIQEDPVMPIWTRNQAGMQGEELSGSSIHLANTIWLNRMEDAFVGIQPLIDMGIHKQNVNRLLEPWMHIKIILTGTDFDNWFELRDHPDAQPEIQSLAKKMKAAMEESKPDFLEPGEWHIPFDSREEDYSFQFPVEEHVKISVARCARISYYNVDGSISTSAKDLELFDKLITSKPLHASPAEHQAQVPYPEDYVNGHMAITHKIMYNSETETDAILIVQTPSQYPSEVKKTIEIDKLINPQLITNKGKYVSNLQGWIQYRKILEEQYNNK